MENNQNVQRLPAEQQYREEIDALIRAEKDWVPAGWKMSPRSVLTYINRGQSGWGGDHSQVHRQQTSGGDRRCNPCDGPSPSSHRGTGNSQVLAVGAPDRCH